MKWYRVLLEGNGFEIILEGRLVAVGFIVTRFVRCLDEEDAAKRAAVEIEQLLQPPRIVSRVNGWKLNVQDVTAVAELGLGWTARVDAVPKTDLFEIHVYRPSGTEAGIVSGSNGWIQKHRLPAARPAGIPKPVVDNINGLNVREMRARGNLPLKGRGNISRCGYLRSGRLLGVAGVVLQVLHGLFSDAETFERGRASGVSFREQLRRDIEEAGSPEYLDTFLGIQLRNPYYGMKSM